MSRPHCSLRAPEQCNRVHGCGCQKYDYIGERETKKLRHEGDLEALGSSSGIISLGQMSPTGACVLEVSPSLCLATQGLQPSQGDVAF